MFGDYSMYPSSLPTAPPAPVRTASDQIQHITANPDGSITLTAHLMPGETLAVQANQTGSGLTCFYSYPALFNSLPSSTFLLNRPPFILASSTI